MSVKELPENRLRVICDGRTHQGPCANHYAVSKEYPIVFNHCNFETMDAVKGMRQGQIIMLTGMEGAPTTVTVPKGKTVFLKVIDGRP